MGHTSLVALQLCFQSMHDDDDDDEMHGNPLNQVRRALADSRATAIIIKGDTRKMDYMQYF